LLDHRPRIGRTPVARSMDLATAARRQRSSVTKMPEEQQHLARRLRATFVICSLASVAFAVADLRWQPPGTLPAMLGFKALQIAVMMGAWALVPLARTTRQLQTIGLVALITLVVCTLIAGILRNDPVTMAFLALAGTLGSATFIPWGGRAQLILNLSTTLSLAVALVLFGDNPIVQAGYPALAIVAALLASVWVAHEQEQRRGDREQVRCLLAGQTRILEMVATGAALTDVLHTICLFVEERAPGMLCSVLLLEGDRLRHGAAPSLPEPYCAAVDGTVIGPDVGSCGSAAYRRVPVIVDDIATDTRWVDFRAIALEHGLAACWSAPIVTSERACLGTFAMYYRERRTPEPSEWQLLQTAAHLAGVAITRSRAEEALTRSRARLEDESRVSTALVRVGQEMISSLNTPIILQRLCQLTAELLDCDASSTVLRDPQDDAFVVRSTHGYDEESLLALHSLRMPSAMLAPLLEQFEGRSSLQISTEAIAHPDAVTLLRQFGVRRSLYVALRRGDEIIGMQSASFRARDGRFSKVHERIALGIAHFAAVALENARLVEELRSATQLKSEFVSTMSHELRTPLSVIIGYTDMLADGELPEDERPRLLRSVHRQSLELLELIEATLSLNRLDSGRDAVQIEDVAVGDLLGALAADYAAMPRPPGAALRWEPAPAVRLRTDPRKLRIVLKNLIGNALKFTPSGSVVVSCTATDEHCSFAVRDTGVGIRADQLPVIFEMFRQGDGSDTRSFSGVGLGLYIVKRLVTQLGGTLAVDSTPGAGSTFTVTVPAGQDVRLVASA
jgi:signal transduction histidine kinase